MKILLAATAFLVTTFAFADSAVAPAVQAGGVLGLIAAKGGLPAFILLIFVMSNSILSGIRLALYKFDGINPGDPIPEDKKALTFVNKICLVLGKVIDFFQGNVPH